MSKGESDNVNLGFQVEVVHGDALEYETEVLAVKDMPYYSGVDAQINLRLAAEGILPKKRTLEDGSYLISGQEVSRARDILYVSMEDPDLTYLDLRNLGYRFLKNLWEAQSEATHLTLTVHGPNLGLDEIESFRALLLGMADAYEEKRFPPKLARVTFVDRSPRRVQRLQEALRQFLPPESMDLTETEWQTETGEAVSKEAATEVVPVIAGPESFEPEFRAPTADESTPHIFVAMPFKEDYDDQFFLAIQPSVKDRGLLCERMDLDTFTGDIMDRMFERIHSAKLVIALLDGGNPNVYLEVGYAWGVKTRTLLIAHKDEPLAFDVRGHRVLIYDRIYKLREMLQEELVRLLG